MSAAPVRLVSAAREALRARRPGLADRLLRAADAAGENAATVALLDARRLLDVGDPDRAKARLAALPIEPAVLRLRAEASLALGRHDAAVADAADCLLADRYGPHAIADTALLGAALLARGDLADAATCLSRALAMTPNDAPQRPDLWVRLARALPTAAARSTLADARARHPAAVVIWTESILLELRDGDPAAAVSLAVAASDAGIADAQVLGLLGHARSLLGRHEAAADAYAQALTLAPTDPYVRHLASAGRGRLAEDARRAPADYVRTVFDGYADRFDAHLMALGYRVPGLVRAAVVGHGARGPVLDLGCGTGLLAVALSDVPLGPWTGVDLSPGMLARAAATGLYGTLREADVEAFLAGDGPSWPLILAGDVFCYLGDLAPALGGVAGRLTPGGLCVFSVEMGDEPWSLRANARFAHGRAALLDTIAAAGLRVRACSSEVLRREGLGTVDGLLLTVERQA